jgi:hypothetical protein
LSYDILTNKWHFFLFKLNNKISSTIIFFDKTEMKNNGKKLIFSTWWVLFLHSHAEWIVLFFPVKVYTCFHDVIVKEKKRTSFLQLRFGSLDLFFSFHSLINLIIFIMSSNITSFCQLFWPKEEKNLELTCILRPRRALLHPAIQ